MYKMLSTFSEQLLLPPPVTSGTLKLLHPYLQAMLWPNREQKQVNHDDGTTWLSQAAQIRKRKKE